MTLEEKMARNNSEDQIEIGMLAERITTGDAGNLLKCIIESIKEVTLQRADADMKIPPDRSLGIIIGLSKLQENLDICVDMKNQLIAEKKKEAEVK